VSVGELRVWERVCCRDVLARLHSRGERAAGAMRACEFVQAEGEVVIDGCLRMLGGVLFGALCCGLGADMKEATSTTRGPDAA
jgi:hypothetical protein